MISLMGEGVVICFVLLIRFICCLLELMSFIGVVVLLKNILFVLQFILLKYIFSKILLLVSIIFLFEKLD